MEPKSGKLHKYGNGIFGAKWTEKWVHLDGKILKYFPMTTEGQVFSLSSYTRPSRAVDLQDYDFGLPEDKKFTRKYVFQLVPKQKGMKLFSFACASEREFKEWKVAFQKRFSLPCEEEDRNSSALSRKLRVAEEIFNQYDPRFTERVDSVKLRSLLQSVGWKGENGDFSLVQQQVDPNLEGKITKAHFMSWLKGYYTNIKGNEPLFDGFENQSDSSHRSIARTESGDPNELSKWDSFVINSVSNQALPARGMSKQEIQFQEQQQQQQQENYDWNDAFDKILVQPRQGSSSNASNDIISHALEVSAFLKRFREAAENITKTVIEEYALDDASKTNKALSMVEDKFLRVNGFDNMKALSKYRRNGMLVYLCHPTDQEYSFGCGQVEIAHKILGHELRAARALHAAMYHIQQSQSKTDSTASPITLSVPLQSVIDYLGFRAYVVATQETTIEIERTIDIKSRDFPALRDQLALLYSALHLSTDTLAINANENVDALPSFVSFDAGLAKKTSIATTASSKNSNSFYLMNTCGIFPADLLKVDMQLQAFFAFKLRPEYVKMYGQVLPLFSNAYRLQYDKSTPSESVFGIEHSKEEHPHFLMDQALATASQHLQQEVIPSFVQSLENNELVIVESRALTHSLHEEGINMRYLGACFEYSTLKHIRKLFLSEMLARACKVIFREFLRNVVYESNTTITRQAASATNVGSSSNSTQTSGRSTESSILQAKDLHSTEEDGSINPATIRALSRMSIQHDVRQTTIEFFNLVLGVLGSNDSKIFWKDRILPLVKSKFGILLSLETILNEEIVHLPQLFLALQMHTNVMFTDTMKYNFKSGGGGAGAGAENSSNGPLSSEHFVILLPITNLLARTTLECENLLEHTDELIHANQLEQALTNIKLHLTIQESAPFDNRNVSMCHLMTCTADLYLKLNAQEKAEKFASLAIEDGPVSNAIVAKAHIVYMKLNHLAGDLHDVQAHFNKAIEVSKWHLGMSHPYLYDTYMTMMEIWHECGELKAALKSLESCACVARECFGRTSLIYADIRHRQGNLLYESKQFEEAISMLEDAVSVYEKHFKDHRLTSSKEKNHTEIKNNNNVDGVSNISQEKCDQEVNVLSPSLTQKELAAACYYLMAVIKMEEPTSSAIEAAYNLALRALSLRQNVLPPNHIAIMESFLQLGTLSKRLGDYYRAIEFFKPALLMLREIRDEHSIVQIRTVTQTIIQLHLKSFAADKQTVIAKIQKRFETSFQCFVNEANTSQKKEQFHHEGIAGEHGEYARVIEFVVKKLFSEDPVAYLDFLVEESEVEIQAMKKQLALSMSPHLTTAPTQSLSHQDASISPPSPVSSSSTHFSSSRHQVANIDLIRTSSGEFTFGIQLAALLYLSSMSLETPTQSLK